MSRIAVAMSGGVDSSVAALLLAEEGRHDVFGVTMKLMPDDPAGAVPTTMCCSYEATRKAKAVCHRLGIPHYTMNLGDQFERFVIRDFCEAYARGSTPNPCLRCNERLKFGALLDLLVAACEIDSLATGHYAILGATGDRIQLKRAVDRSKDQSYALYGLTQEQLARAVFPLGGLQKEEVRELAHSHGLATADTPESQDLCFVPGGDYREFLDRHITATPGPVVDGDGNIRGEHDGLHHYTVGQRAGIAGNPDGPLYVTGLDDERNTVIVGLREELPRHYCLLEDVNWVSIAPPPVGEEVEGEAMVRYRSKMAHATLTVLSETTARAHLPVNEGTLTPGQSLVLYDGDTVLVGGVISEAWN